MRVWYAIRSSSIRVVCSRRASSSGVSLGIFLFAIVFLLEQAPDDSDVLADVAEQAHDSGDILVIDRRFDGGIVAQNARPN